MALIQCVECGREISDRAAFCPQCGCPPSASSQSTPPGPSTVIAELEELIRNMQQSTVEPVSAQHLADRIADRKKEAFASKEAFIDASVQSGALILSNNDLDLLGTLHEDQKQRIARIYAISCTRLDDTITGKTLWTFNNATALDLSYCPTISCPGGAKSATTIYLRSCRGLTDSGVFGFAKMSSGLTSLYLDGNPQLKAPGIAAVVLRHRAIQLLSIVGCAQLSADRDFLAIVRERCPSCKLVQSI